MDVWGATPTIRAVGTSASNPSLTLTSVGITAWSQTVSGSDSSLSFNKDGSEKMRIASSGNVGIGTTNPPYKLTVAGDTYVNNANLHINSGYGIVNAANISHKIGFPSLGNFAFENVNVGIGTTSPSQKLQCRR